MKSEEFEIPEKVIEEAEWNYLQYQKVKAKVDMQRQQEMVAKFNVQENQDPEYVFPEELEMANQLRRRIPETKSWTDKKLIFFLSARNYELEQAETSIRNWLSKLDSAGYGKHFPSFDETRFCMITSKDQVQKDKQTKNKQEPSPLRHHPKKKSQLRQCIWHRK